MGIWGHPRHLCPFFGGVTGCIFFRGGALFTWTSNQSILFGVPPSPCASPPQPHIPPPLSPNLDGDTPGIPIPFLGGSLGVFFFMGGAFIWTTNHSILLGSPPSLCTSPPQPQSCPCVGSPPLKSGWGHPSHPYSFFEGVMGHFFWGGAFYLGLHPPWSFPSSCASPLQPHDPLPKPKPNRMGTWGHPKHPYFFFGGVTGHFF